MAETYNFGMPLLDAAQAQKHVTVNEAIARADAVAQLRLKARGVTAPPVAVDGTAFGIGAAATGDWADHDGEIAVQSNGGWVFMPPKLGWRGWDEATKEAIIYDGADWKPETVAIGLTGAATHYRIVEFDHVITAGATSTTSEVIPASVQVMGVTGRVITGITGAGVSSWALGVAGSNNRYGSGLGLGLNSWARGLTGNPLTYYADEALVLTPDAGTFTSGTVRLCIHYVELSVPRAV